MRDAAHSRTVCEVLREINDIHQGDTQIDISTRAMLREAVDMAKRMDRRLKEYNQEWDKDWWENNPNVNDDIERRMAVDYLAMDDDTIPEAIRRIPSMGGREIGRYLREWAARAQKGQAIVELGSWLGAGTAQLALGVAQSKRGVVVHAFDRFKANQSEIQKAATHGIVVKAGDSTVDLVRGLITPSLAEHVAFHQGEIMKAKWNGQPIAVYVDDACKREKEFLHALRTFGPSFIPNETVIVLMDFWYFERYPEDRGLRFQHDWMKKNINHFEHTQGRMPGTSATVFRYLRGKPWAEVK
jgi:hypothetical protein